MKWGKIKEQAELYGLKDDDEIDEIEICCDEVEIAYTTPEKRVGTIIIE